MIPDIFKADAVLAAAAAAAAAARGEGDRGGDGSSSGSDQAAAVAAEAAAAVVNEYPGFASVIRMDFVQETGQTVFVPAGWHHQVENIVETLSVNRNWINCCNIADMFDVLCQDLKLVSVKLRPHLCLYIDRHVCIVHSERSVPCCDCPRDGTAHSVPLFVLTLRSAMPLVARRQKMQQQTVLTWMDTKIIVRCC